MPTFYFIDSNLIIGYCNFLDIHHLRARNFLDNLNMRSSRSIILLKSIEEEFNRKIQDQMAKFIEKIKDLINRTSNDINEVIENWIFDPINKNFERYILTILESQIEENIDNDVLLETEIEYYTQVGDLFDTLTRLWIKYPNINEIRNIKNTTKYKEIEDMLSGYLHARDRSHLSFAIYRAKIHPEHNHIFYTTDYSWENMNDVIICSNYKIQVLLRKKVLIGSREIAFYCMMIYKILTEENFCIVLARGQYINKAIDVCLFLKDHLLQNIEFIKIIPGTEFIGNRYISSIEIILSFY